MDRTDPGLPPISFFDLKAQQARLRGRFEQRFSDILDHGRFIAGPEVEELENALAAWTGAADAVAVGSGTQALIMPLLALGLGHGDAVFIPAFTYNATANAVLLANATPVFVDVDPDSFNMSPENFARRIDQVKRRRGLRPRAVIPVDLYGTPADYPAIAEIAEANGMQVVADAAQSFGGRQAGRWVGAIAPVTATSFYPTKALGGMGDGGAILVDDPDMADMLRSIRWHGTDAARRDSVRVGLNGRLDSIQCAVIAEKLAIFDEELTRRTEIAAIYEERLAGLCRLQARPADTESGYGLFTVAVERRRARTPAGRGRADGGLLHDPAAPHAGVRGVSVRQRAARRRAPRRPRPLASDARLSDRRAGPSCLRRVRARGPGLGAPRARLEARARRR